ncbi:hypothetical protein SAY87_030266 [Trapa incisa]|uniref:Zinc finger PHD-type domain-containing protein n=1 Tax=Trapa incisa TaxID=236973 RepID=A0AAN7KN54_9MYRT|nr:hypothetical protein SAY87_030266 [Trapa incisa]
MEKVSTTCNVRVKRCSTFINISHDSSNEEQKQNTSHTRNSKERTSTQVSAKIPDLCPLKRSSLSDIQCSIGDTSNPVNSSLRKMQSQNSGAVEVPDSPADDTSCVSGLDAINITAENSSNDAERKNSGSGSSASINSFLSSGKMFNDPQNIPDKLSTNSEESVNNQVARPSTTSEPLAAKSSKSPPLRECLPKEASACSNEKGELLSTTKPFRELPKISEHSDAKKGKEKLLVSRDQNCIVELPLPSRSADAINRPDLPDEDVRVCDICGDVGREYLLAICAKCNDGAEHIYCMRVKMDKVPASDWICEDCKINQELEKGIEKKVEEVDKVLKRTHSTITSQSHGSLGPANLKRLKVDTGVSAFEKKTANSVSCSPKLPSKISSVNLEVLPVTKKRTLEINGESPKGIHTQEMPFLSGSSSPRNTSQGKVKTFLSSSSSRTTFSAGKSVLKWNSFNIRDKKVKDCQLQRDKNLGGSLSFKDARTVFSVSDISNDKKMLSPKSPLAKDQIRVRRTGDQISHLKNLTKFGSNADDKRGPRSVEFLQKPLNVTNHHAQKKSQGRAHLSDSLKLKKCPPEKCPEVPLKENDKVVERVKAETECKDKKLDAYRSFKGHYLNNFVPYQEGIIPQVDFIWKGNFEVSRSEVVTNLFPSIQAHKSNRASDKVDEVMAKSPQKIILDEVPRLSTWPAQFKDSPAVEDNIALFFFAQNLVSYEAYKRLLMHVTVNDLALKGHIEGVELLVFSSKVLPPGSQRWNNLLYLWGVFRTTRISSSENEKASQNQLCSPGCNTNCTPSLQSSDGPALVPPERVSEIAKPAVSSPGPKSSPLPAVPLPVIDHQLSSFSKLSFPGGKRDSYELDLEVSRETSTKNLPLGGSSNEALHDRKMKGILNEPSKPSSHLSNFLEPGPVFRPYDFASTSGSLNMENAAMMIPRYDEPSILWDVDLQLSLGPPINLPEKRKAWSLSSEESEQETRPKKGLQRAEDELSLCLSLSL